MVAKNKAIDRIPRLNRDLRNILSHVSTANAPKGARNSSEVPGTGIIKLFFGAKVLVRRGIAAPTAKLRADAKAV
jgi:hypothetical protein